MAMYDPDFFMEWDDDGDIEDVDNSSVACKWAPQFNYVIDTIKNECGNYETAIRFEDSEIDLTGKYAFNFTEWIVVELYSSYSDATEGHKFWCDICKNFAPKLFKDVVEDEWFFAEARLK